jgi:hypothetical protein
MNITANSHDINFLCTPIIAHDSENSYLRIKNQKIPIRLHTDLRIPKVQEISRRSKSTTPYLKHQTHRKLYQLTKKSPYDFEVTRLKKLSHVHVTIQRIESSICNFTTFLLQNSTIKDKRNEIILV